MFKFNLNLNMINLYLLMIFNLILVLMNLSMYFMYNKIVIFLEYEFFKLVSMKFEFLILLDWLSLLFITVVLMITFMVIIYSIEYMSNDININRFIIMIMLFVMFMIFMIMSPNLISILLGWDGLGLISYCLVIFYQNEYSYNSGMVTVISNRMGDSILLILIGLIMMNGSWNFMYYNYLSFLILFLLMIVSFTKSAQIPFSAWLPKAMAAPTPVSSLVHSSTLVTAGVYLLIRFNYLMKMNLLLMKMLMFISIMTLFMSGLAANFEYDFKKIIALSTLSQLGLMIFCLSIGLPIISYFHLLTHAMFKCMLFMCAGIVIHNMINNQDIRFISMIFKNMPIISMIFNCSSMSLCGIPFMSGFFSKDKILEMYMMNNFNMFMFMILFISMGLTVMYSFRLMYYSFINIPSLNLFYNYKSLNSLMFYSMLFLFLMSIILGFVLNWMIFSFKNLIFLTKKLKLIIYIFMMFGMLMGFMIINLRISLLKLMNLMNYLIFFMMMWFLFIIYKMKMLNLMKIFQKTFFFFDLKWNEYIISLMIYNYYKMKLYNLDLLMKNFFFIFIIIIYLIMYMFCL